MTSQRTRGLLLAALGLMFGSAFLIARGSPGLGAAVLFCGFAAAWRSRFKLPAVFVPVRVIWMVAAVVFFSALAVRLFRLDFLPPVLWDEGLQAYDARCVLAGYPLEELKGVYFHRSPMWTAFLAGFGHAAGFSFFSLRLPSAILGALLCALVFAWGAGKFGVSAALFGAAWLSFTPASLNISRMVFGNILVPLTGMVIVMVVSSGRLALMVCASAAGVLAGAAMYGYAGGFYLPVLASAGSFLLHPVRASLMKRAAAAGLALAVSILVSAPLFFDSSGYWDKVRDVSLLGRPAELAGNFLETAGMFHAKGDASLTHQYPPDAPLMGLLLGPVFSLGLALALRSAGSPGTAFLFVWLALAILPGVLSQEGSRNLFRMAGVFPSAALFLSAGAAALPLLFSRRTGLLVLLALLSVTAFGNLHAYFRDFPSDKATGVWFRTYHLEAAKSMKEVADVLPVRMCSPLDLALHPLEKFILFDHLHNGRMVGAQGRCGRLGLYKIFRDSMDVPQAVLLIGRSRSFPATISMDYRTVIDIGLEGDRMMKESRSGEAAVLYRGYLKWIPDSFLLEERLGFALLKAGEPAGAVDAFIRGISAGSQSAATFNGLAAAWFALGDYESAAAALRKALAIEPGNPEFIGDMERVRRAMEMAKGVRR